MPGLARKRWAILAEVIKSKQTEEERRRREGTKRSFHAYNLITWGREEQDGWRKVSHGQTQCEVRLSSSSSSPSLTQLVGFNNTGNVCVWPSEECLAVYCLANTHQYRGLKILELGGGMTGLAGLLVANTGHPALVSLSDGNLESVASLDRVVARRGEGGCKLESFHLRWDDPESVSPHRGQYDVILSADCLFFTAGLAPAMHCLLREGGRALVMAPGREGTFDRFKEEAKDYFGSVEEAVQYSGEVWKAHEACLEMENYLPDIHYPRLMVLTKS